MLPLFGVKGRGELPAHGKGGLFTQAVGNA